MEKAIIVRVLELWSEYCEYMFDHEGSYDKNGLSLNGFMVWLEKHHG